MKSSHIPISPTTSSRSLMAEHPHKNYQISGTHNIRQSMDPEATAYYQTQIPQQKSKRRASNRHTTTESIASNMNRNHQHQQGTLPPPDYQQHLAPQQQQMRMLMVQQMGAPNFSTGIYPSQLQQQAPPQNFQQGQPLLHHYANNPPFTSMSPGPSICNKAASRSPNSAQQHSGVPPNCRCSYTCAFCGDDLKEGRNGGAPSLGDLSLDHYLEDENRPCQEASRSKLVEMKTRLPQNPEDGMAMELVNRKIFCAFGNCGLLLSHDQVDLHMLKHQRKVASMTTPPQAIYTPPPAGYGSLSQAQQSYGQQPHQPLHQANWSENRHSRVEQPLQPVPQRRASQSLPTVPQPVQIQRENYYAPQVVPEQILRQLQALTTIYQGPQAHSTRGQNGQFMGLGTQSAAAEYGHMGQQAGYQYMENQTSNSPVNLQQFDLGSALRESVTNLNMPSRSSYPMETASSQRGYIEPPHGPLKSPVETASTNEYVSNLMDMCGGVPGNYDVTEPSSSPEGGASSATAELPGSLDSQITGDTGTVFVAPSVNAEPVGQDELLMSPISCSAGAVSEHSFVSTGEALSENPNPADIPLVSSASDEVAHAEHDDSDVHGGNHSVELRTDYIANQPRAFSPVSDSDEDMQLNVTSDEPPVYTSSDPKSSDPENNSEAGAKVEAKAHSEGSSVVSSGGLKANSEDFQQSPDSSTQTAAECRRSPDKATSEEPNENRSRKEKDHERKPNRPLKRMSSFIISRSPVKKQRLESLEGMDEKSGVGEKRRIRKFVCFCGEVSVSRCDWKIHLAHHGIVRPTRKQKKLLCPREGCRYVADDINDLQRHVARHILMQYAYNLPLEERQAFVKGN